MVSSELSQVEKALTAEYGLYLRHGQVAELLDISPESLRNTMRRCDAPNVVYLCQHKLQFGRRIRYFAGAVAEALVLNGRELERRLQQSKKGGPGDEA